MRVRCVALPCSGEKDDVAKVRFVRAAVTSTEAVFEKQLVLDKDIVEAAEWGASKSVQEVHDARESVVCAIERLAAKLVKSSQTDRWFGDADAGVRSVSSSVNGPLFELLAKRVAYDDVGCIELFRLGGVLVGELERHVAYSFAL